MTNFYGELVGEAAGDITPKNGVVLLDLPDTEKGYFELTVFVDGYPAGATTYSIIEGAALDDVEPAASPFGINTALRKNPAGVLEEALSREIQILGAKSIRDGSEWKSIEREKSVYAPQLNDELVRQMAEQYQIDYLYVAGYENPLYDKNSAGAGQTPWTENGRAGYADMANWLAERYRYIGLYNEWNGGFGKRGGSPANSQPGPYHSLVKKTYETVKPNHPDTVLVGPAFAQGGYDGGTAFLTALGQLGTLEYLDVIAGNMYRVDLKPEFIKHKLMEIDSIVKAYHQGSSKELWVTETGYPIWGDVTEAVSATYLVPLYVNALSAGAKKVFWYNLADTGINPAEREENYGLLRHEDSVRGGNTAKPSFVAYSVMTRQLTGLVYQEELSTETVQAHWFQNAERACTVVWSYEGGIFTLPSQLPVTVTDFMGNRKVAAPQDGVVTIAVSDTPVYVESGSEEQK